MGGSRPIKVMHIIARMNVGGPAVEIVELMRGLDPQIVSQRLVTGYCDENEADYLETQAPDIQATRIQGLGRSIRPTDDAKALAHLIKLIRSSRPDIVHTHTAKAGVLGRLAAKFSGTGTMVVHTYHGHLLNGYFTGLKKRGWVVAERSLAGLTRRLISVGDSVKLDLLDEGIGQSEQHVVIRSGVQVRSEMTQEQARRLLDLPATGVIVAYVGRLTQVKRPDRFLRVVKTLKDDGLDVHFVVVGSGELEQYVRERVESEDLPVTLFGWREDVHVFLAAADMLLITSDNEGIPLTILEAQACGLPVVATNVGSIGEVVRHGENGFLSAPETAELVKYLRLLITDESMRSGFQRDLAEGPKAQDRLNFFLNDHKELYRQLLSGSADHFQDRVDA